MFMVLNKYSKDSLT